MRHVRTPEKGLDVIRASQEEIHIMEYVVMGLKEVRIIFIANSGWDMGFIGRRHIVIMDRNALQLKRIG